jgi:hypothetical protein
MYALPLATIALFLWLILRQPRRSAGASELSARV